MYSLPYSSMFMVQPFRSLYRLLARRFLATSDNPNGILISRLETQFDSESNISGVPIGPGFLELDALSLDFQRALVHQCADRAPRYDGEDLYLIQTRRMKAKLLEVLKCALQLDAWGRVAARGQIWVTSDAQTIALIKAALDFLGCDALPVEWKVSSTMGLVVWWNSLFMRMAVKLQGLRKPSMLPRRYFRTKTLGGRSTILVIAPMVNTQSFISGYVSSLAETFNVVLYSLADLDEVPVGFEECAIQHQTRGWDVKPSLVPRLGLTSYLDDLCLITPGIFDLSRSKDVVETVFSEENIDVMLNRSQAHIVFNQFVLGAKARNIVVICDVFEEVYDCDRALVSYKAKLTPLIRCIQGCREPLVRSRNELILTRLRGYEKPASDYLHRLLGVEEGKAVFFYASDPGNAIVTMKQRYDAEVFMMRHFRERSDAVLLIKTHPQDDGTTTLRAFQDTGSPKNVILVGDESRGAKMASEAFRLIPEFDFKAAMMSSAGLISPYSTALLEGAALGAKVGVLDMIGHDYFRDLTDRDGALLIDSPVALDLFIERKGWRASRDALAFYGLDDSVACPDFGDYLLDLLDDLAFTQEGSAS